MFANLNFNEADRGLLKSDGFEILIDSGLSLCKYFSLLPFGPKAFSLTIASGASSDKPENDSLLSKTKY